MFRADNLWYEPRVSECPEIRLNTITVNQIFIDSPRTFGLSTDYVGALEQAVPQRYASEPDLGFRISGNFQEQGLVVLALWCVEFE